MNNTIDAPNVQPIDAPESAVCNPLAAAGQQGCEVGQKCTWITIQDTPDSVGKIGCVPDGTVDHGGDCTIGAAGETTGYDDCKAGNICVAGTCKDVCGFGGGADEVCANGEACTRYSDLWANGDDEPMYGACNPTCNPVTQQRSDGTMCPAGNGCYLLVSSTTSTAVCASAGTVMAGTAIQGQAFANSCVPGAQPRAANDTDQTVECGGLCDPKDVYVTNPSDVTFMPANDMAAPQPQPANKVTNYAAEGGMVPNDCQGKWEAAPPGDVQNGESCRYWWAREGFDDLSPFSNTVGWCFKHAAFHYDSDGNMADDHAFPRCVSLSSGDNVLPISNPPGDDATYFWCKALPTMLRTSIKNVKKDIQIHEPRMDRLGSWR
ncbi:MAG TPA: hypothetical protein VHE35_11910 [Kofleriaceae bacterium]|nr:hypothetical protein [Kofleriaceae bacterium]